MTPSLHFNQQQHTMLLYPIDDEEDAIARYVNEALGRGQLTVYLPVNGDNNNNDASHSIQNALSDSIGYKENMNRDNLLTFDTKAFYNFALAGNLQPFEELKVLIEEAIEEKQVLSKGKVANDEDQDNFILMHAMGANTAGQLGSVIAGGILLAIVSKLI